MRKYLALSAIAVVLAVVFAGCGGGGGGGAAPTSDVTLSVSAPTSETLTFNSATQVYTGSNLTLYAFGANVTGTTNTSVMWSVTTPSGGATNNASISSTGVFSATQPGTYIIKATSVADPSRVSSVTIIIADTGPPPPPSM